MSARRNVSGIGAAAWLGIAFAVAGCAARPSRDAASWWSHLKVLAADSLRGRMTGTSDYLASARYVAGEFRRLGVRPGGSPAAAAADSDEAYFQHVPFVWRKIREPECAVSLAGDSRVAPLVLGRDASIGLAIDPADTLAASMVFVGYGLALPEAGWNELEGLDLRGKFVIYVRSGPRALEGPRGSHAQAADVRWAGLRAAGAIGAAGVSPPRGGQFPWERFVAMRLQPSLAIADSSLDELPDARLFMRLNPAHLDRFLEGSGHTAAEILALADSGARLPVFPLARSLRARVRYDRKVVDSPNVVGIIPGSDPRLRDEYVVVSAHLDHLGVGAPVEGDSIYNGAMDNASGVASLLEFARRAHALGSPFRRSVVLLAVTGEEEGLEGSRWYAARPTVPAGSIVADINLDMFLPIVPLEVITVFGLKESDLGDRFVKTAKAAGVAVQDDPEPQRNYFIRSDQYSFIRRGVPSLMFELGAKPGTREAKRLEDWRRQHYHQPSDDLFQPLDLEVAARFTRLLFDFTREVANTDEPPRWKQDSFFRRFAPATHVAARGAPAPVGGSRGRPSRAEPAPRGAGPEVPGSR